MRDIGLSPTQRATEPTAATDAARLEPGAKVGEYVVDRFLGAGAMGEVYAGVHPVIGKKVAIKVLKPSLAASDEAAARFTREAKVVNQINHPNVIDVFAFNRLDDGRLYLVMDLVEGQTLRAAVQDGPMDVVKTLDILDQIADALDAAHGKGVVHRDLKPDNVMLAGTKVHVLDFGIAKLLDTGDAAKPATLLTGQGAWIGTPGYMAPEQWSADGAGPASDRYALGVMAFELLSGKLPFQAPTLPQMMEQHFRAPVPALSTRGAVPTRAMFDSVLARAMSKDPDKRYASAKAFVQALRDASGRKLRRSVTTPKKLWLPATIGVGVLGVAVVGVVAVRGGPKSNPGVSPSPSGFVALEIRSNPPRATVMRGDKMYGTTPAKLEVRDGEQLDLTIKKPGFSPAQKTVKASEDTRAVDVVLVQANAFEGTWILSGQLRAFTRGDDEHVDVFKMESLCSEKQFYRKFTFEDAATGVKFSNTDTVPDARAPTEPSCQIPVRVEYQYDPQKDSLDVRREDVFTDFQDGHCVVQSREMTAAVTLVRANRGTTDIRKITAPVGIPLDQGQLNPQPTAPNDDKALKQQEEELFKKGKGAKTPPKQKKAPPNKKAALDDFGSLNTGNATNAPNPPPQKQSKAPVQPPTQQPQPQAPNAPDESQQQQVKGDSQVAPVKK